MYPPPNASVHPQMAAYQAAGVQQQQVHPQMAAYQAAGVQQQQVHPQMAAYQAAGVQQQQVHPQMQAQMMHPQMHPQMMHSQMQAQMMHPQMQAQMMRPQMMPQQNPGQPMMAYGQYQQSVAGNPGLSEMEKNQILNFFSQAAGIDRLLDPNEFAMVLAQLQPQYAQSPQFSMISQRYFQEIDVDRNGYIDANEFLQAYVRLKAGGFQ